MVVLSTNFTKEFSPCRRKQILLCPFAFKYLPIQPVQSWVYSMNRRGLGTRPLGASVLSTRVEEEWLPIQTVWGLFVWKFNIHLQRVVLKPRVLSLPIKPFLNFHLLCHHIVVCMCVLFACIKYIFFKKFASQFHGGDCVERWTEINKQHSDVGVVIFKVCEDWVEGSGDDILCGLVCSECKLLRVQAGWDVVFDVLENQFLKALHQNGGECHRVVVDSWLIWHCRLFMYRNDGGCLEVGGNTLLWQWDVKNVSELAGWYMFLVHGQGCYQAQQLYSLSLSSGFFLHPLWIPTVAGPLEAE